MKARTKASFVDYEEDYDYNTDDIIDHNHNPMEVIDTTVEDEYKVYFEIKLTIFKYNVVLCHIAK